jgi:hypothetical protein
MWWLGGVRNLLVTMSVLAFVNMIFFELFSNMHFYIIEKEGQFLAFLQQHDFFLINDIAEYIHRRAPFMETIPYSNPATDGRLSTWFLPPHQIVIEWLIYGILFLGTIVVIGKPNHSVCLNIGKQPRRSWIISLLFITSTTLVAVLYYKFKAWIELNEWFAILYLLQPCHVVLAGYVVLLVGLLNSQIRPTTFSLLLTVLFDMQWTTVAAIAFPDTRAMIERNFLGEEFLFWFEHALLIVLPYIVSCVRGVRGRDGHIQPRIYRCWYSVCWFGVHNLHVMTPVSLIGGVQVNYQTHLPQFAVSWFGRSYKFAIMIISLLIVGIIVFMIQPFWIHIIQDRSRDRKVK